jgi:hypothetical protein
VNIYSLGMIHSLISVIYDAAFKQCSNIRLPNEIQRKSINAEKPSTVAIGIAPDSAAVM